MRRTYFLCLSTILSGVVVSGVAYSAKPTPGLGQSKTSGSSDRDFLISHPIAAERPQLRLHLELNMANEAGIALEGGVIGETEELGPKEIEETGNSLKVRGAQASLLISRYSEPTRLGGFFWTLGAGYRQFVAEWKKKPTNQVGETRLATADSDGYLRHRINGRGTFGTARFGYRYVAAEWPLAIGAHVGIRHMNSVVKDAEVEDEEESKLNLTYSQTDSGERRSIQNRLMTQPDFTLDAGIVF
jgi:hypothetical protein